MRGTKGVNPSQGIGKGGMKNRLGRVLSCARTAVIQREVKATASPLLFDFIVLSMHENLGSVHMDSEACHIVRHH